MKKAISAATSAALLASLLATAVAPSAFAAVTATSAGTFAIGTTSTGTVTFKFTETSATAINAAGSFSVTICDSSILVANCAATGATAAHVSFSGTPSLTGSTGSLGASATVAGNVLTVKWTAFDSSVEEIDVAGLKIAASSLAQAGPIAAVLSNVTGQGFAPFFAPSDTATTTATGTIQASNTLAAGADTADILLSSVCPFAATNATTPGGATVNSNATFSDAADARAVASVLTPVLGVQAVTFAAGTLAHPAGTTVTQTVSQLNCGASVLPAAVGVIANALGFSAGAVLNVFPGESNSLAADLTLTEPIAGFLPDGTTVTATIKTAGVTFSTRPIATVTTGNLILTGSLATAVLPVNEVQTVTLAPAAGTDTFTLSFDSVSTGALNATTTTAAQLQAALQALSTIGAGNVTVTSVPGVYTITFVGALAGTNVNALVATITGGTIVDATTTQGVSAVAAGAAPMTLSADRTAATFTVDTASTVRSTILISNIRYDVASTVAGGTFVTVGVTAGALAVNPATNDNAVVGRGLTTTATPTIVNIGQNAQKTGLVTITELAAGFFQGGTGTNNQILVCLPGVYTFTSPGPSAKVTSGDLVLRNGDVAAAAGAVVLGTAVFNASIGDTCYLWKVWTASTAVSTITIGNADVSSGPLINVPANSTPGAVNMTISLGNGDVIPVGAAVAATVQIATAVFQNSVVVTALSQPVIPVGSNGSSAGDIQIQETANGQLKFGEEVCVEIVPNQQAGTLTDAFLKGLNTADVPTVTTTNGILAGPVTFSNQNCLRTLTANPGTFALSFAFVIQQQSVGANGKLVISNIKYATVNDAVTGPVQVNVFGLGASNTQVQFQSVVSNAKIGVAAKLGIGAVSALGLRPTTGYTTKTPKTQVVRKYITWKFTGGQTLAGQRVNIMIAKKVNGAWGGPKYFVSRVADANGIVTFWWKFNTAAAINVRVQWPGNTSFAVSTSRALGGYWK